MAGQTQQGGGHRTDMDALAAALRKAGPVALQHAALETDHSFSDHRIALQAIVLRWLESLKPSPGSPVSSRQ